MLHDKANIVNKLGLIFDNLEFVDDNNVKIHLNKLLTPQQKYQLAMAIIKGLDKDDFECVIDFHDKFKVGKENTHIVHDFRFSLLRLSLIMEETLELAFALGFDRSTIYNIFINILGKVTNKNIEASLTEVADALTDILFVTYGAIDVFNLKAPQHSLMQEVYSSNMSKLINKDTMGWLTAVQDTVKKYKTENTEVVSEDLNNGYIAIINKETRKILKPVTYKSPDLKKIINNHLNK